jgi:putative CocE/NonD family hydrolase
MRRWVWLLLCTMTLAGGAAAQEFPFPAAAATDRSALAQAAPALAGQVLKSYREDDRARYLSNVFPLQILSGDYDAALRSAAELRTLRQQAHPARAAWMSVQFEVYAAAKLKQHAQQIPFDEAYRQAFRERFARLDDVPAALVVRALGISNSVFDGFLERDLAKQKGGTTIAPADAIQLLRDFMAAEAYREPAALFASLIAEDDARRYVTEKDVRVALPDGGTVCALIVRPRGAQRLPALLEYTIYADADTNLRFSARPAASHGYVGIVGLVRGKGCSPDKPVPYVRDSADAAALIDWIARQSWSNGRVGMFGGSYSGGTAWAATKRMPKALKSILVGAPVAPGIDVPMEGNVFWSFVYPWPFYTTDNQGLDDATYNDSARWNKLNHDWYANGRAYRDLDKIDGTPNPIFDEWLSHPSYDAYWQQAIPYRDEFAHIDIPVLQTSGYFGGGPGGSVYYFLQHYRHRTNAQHYLVVGPYDHPGAQHGTIGLLGQEFGQVAGYPLDPVARVDFDELRYEWFDWVLKGRARPAMLADKVNYQVMGANVWKHAPSLAAMHTSMRRFYLSGERSGDGFRLALEKPARPAVLPLKVDLADRSDVDREVPGGGFLDKAVDTASGLLFESDPFATATEISGLFRGSLEVTANRRDFDFEVDLYERTAKGDYLALAPYWSRASFVDDISHRRLLQPGKPRRITFESTRLMSCRMEPGSRLVAVLHVIKETGRQVNMGTGKDVSDETVIDGKLPLELHWSTQSYFEIPVADER